MAKAVFLRTRGPRRYSGRPLHVHPGVDAAADQAADSVLNQWHREGVLLGDLVQEPQVYAPADFCPFLVGGHKVERPWAVGRFDDVVAEPFVKLPTEVGLKSWIYRLVTTLDWRHILHVDAVLKQVGVSVSPVVGEQVPEFRQDGHCRSAFGLRSETRLPVDHKDRAEVVQPFVWA